MRLARRSVLSIATAICLLPLVSAASGQDGEPTAAAVHAVVEKVSRPAVIDAKGHLLALDRTQITYYPAAYRGEWILREVAEPGTRVRKGQVVAGFDREEISEELERTRFDMETSTIAHRHLEAKIDLDHKRIRDEIIRTERDIVEARLRLRGWVDHQLAFAREDARLNDESWKTSLDNLKEELAELEKMYSEDELVEATEELVLNRTRRSLVQRLASYEQAMKKRAFQVEFEESRRAEDLEVDLEMRERAYARRRVQLEMEERDRQIGFERSKQGLEAKEKNLRQLSADLEAMSVRAPRDGVLLHGADVTDTSRREPGDRLNPRQAFLTVVDPAALTVRFQVPARKLLRLAVGQTLMARPEVDGAGELAGRVEVISMFVSGDQNLTLLGRIEAAPGAPGAVGGVACSVRLTTGTEEVLVVSRQAVERDGEATFCQVRKSDGTHEKRAVKLGDETSNGFVVTDGLAAGDEVLIVEKKK